MSDYAYGDVAYNPDYWGDRKHPLLRDNLPLMTCDFDVWIVVFRDDPPPKLRYEIMLPVAIAAFGLAGVAAAMVWRWWWPLS